ncbi:hypothetical protein RUND412_005970 [Rhizina undulata]
MRPYAVRQLTRRTLYLGGLLCTSSTRSLHLSQISATTPTSSCLRRKFPCTVHTISGARRFWGFGEADKKKPRPSVAEAQTKDVDDIGIETMTRLLRFLDQKIGRPPADFELLRVFRNCIRTVNMPTPPAGYYEALLRTYLYLRNSIKAKEIPSRIMRQMLHTVERGGTKYHVDLARLVMKDLGKRPDYEHDLKDYLRYINCLCNSGCTENALKIFEEVHGSWEHGVKSAFEKILRGWRKEGMEKSLLGTWDLMQTYGIEYTPRHFQQVTLFYLHKGDLETAKSWYYRSLESIKFPTLRVYSEILKACVKANDRVWGNKIIDMLYKGDETIGQEFQPNKEHCNLALEYALPMGRSVEEVDNLLAFLSHRAADSPTAPMPDITSFNSLMRYGVEKNDHAIFEHYLKIAEQWSLKPNIDTLGLQLEFYVNSSSLQKAHSVYESFRLEEIPDGFEFNAVRKYIRALCSQPTWDPKQIRAIFSDLVDWNVRLDISTFCALLRVLLEETLFAEVIELCEREAETYILDERKLIITEIGEYIGRSTTSVEAAWDAYTILYQVCPELTVRERTDIMRLFFDLGRSDMAYHVLQHMRKNPQRFPTKHTYTAAFTGIAYSQDIEALRLVHNQLKLDMDIDPDTRLMNSLMNAYNYCGVYGRVLAFWDDIRRSKEGPDYASISIVLDACGRMAAGLAQAKKIWGELKGMKIKLHQNNFVSYIEALTRHERFEDAFNVVREMESERGVRPNAKVLGTLHTTMIPELRTTVREWAQETYPAEWKEAEGMLEKMEEDNRVVYSMEDELSTYNN